MDLLEKLERKPFRSDPDIWVSRFVILERILPKPVFIRDIALKRGLNIVWAEDIEDDNPPGEITGHSAGKTTFCRLLRYVLGEKSFGSKATVELTRKAFPDGYVAAELNIFGRKWAVRRPLGGGRMTYIKEDSSVEELLEQHGHSVTQESYPEEIGLEGLLNRLETGAIVQTGEPIQWSHILAWCARDQEARFQNVYDWRSTRSESDPLSFRFPKAGPLFVMRTVLGLFLPDELRGEEKVARLQQQKDKIVKKIEERRQEPDFRVNLYDGQLRQLLKAILTDETDIESRPLRSHALLPEDIARLTEKARRLTEEALEDVEKKRASLQEEIDGLGAELRRYEEESAKMESLLGMTAAAHAEAETATSKRETLLKEIEEAKNSSCRLGGVPFRDCRYVQERRNILSLSDARDVKVLEDERQRRLEICRIIEEDKAHYSITISETKRKLQTAVEERKVIEKDAQECRSTLHKLTTAWSDLLKWVEKRDQPGEDDDLSRLRQQLATTESQMAEIESELSALLDQHDKNREILTLIFSKIVKSVLASQHYDGEVNLHNRELSFVITHGSSMTGEAIETLSVLLADISCLIYNSVNDAAHLPGFLMHDSPREADLGLKIYRSFIRLVASLENQFREQGVCPFQYVITTTTPPPPELNVDEYVRLRLNAARTEDLLFRRNIAASRSRGRNREVLL